MQTINCDELNNNETQFDISEEPIDVTKFITSTPKKQLKKCFGCVNPSECIACIMKHVLGGQGDYTWR